METLLRWCFVAVVVSAAIVAELLFWGALTAVVVTAARWAWGA